MRDLSPNDIASLDAGRENAYSACNNKLSAVGGYRISHLMCERAHYDALAHRGNDDGVCWRGVDAWLSDVAAFWRATMLFHICIRHCCHLYHYLFAQRLYGDNMKA